MKLFLLIALATPTMLLFGNEVQSRAFAPQLKIALASQNPLVDPRSAQTVPVILSQVTPPPTNEIKVLVKEVVIKTPSGQPPLPPELEKKVYDVISTKSGLTITRTQLQADINAVFAMGFFSNVQAEPEDTKNGVRVNFVVTPNPVLKAVNTQGTKILESSLIARIFGSQIGKITNLKDIQAGVKTLEKYYKDNGYLLAQVVEIKAQPEGVLALIISEGEVEDIKVGYLNKDGEPVVGNTPYSFILREFSLKKGDIFNKETIESDLKKASGFGLFYDLNLGLKPGSDPRKVIVTVNVIDRSVSEANVKLDDYPKAITYFEQALKSTRELKDRKKEVDILSNLGFAYITSEKENEKDYPKAIAYFEQALKIARELKDRKDEVDILRGLGFGYSEQKDYPKAINSYDQVLKIARELKYQDAEWRALLSLGQVYKNQTDYLKVISYYEQSLKIVRELKDRNAEANVLLGLSGVYVPLADYPSAIAYSEKALAISQEIKDPKQARDKTKAALAIMLIGYGVLGDQPKMLVYSDKLWEVYRADEDLKKKDSLGILSSLTKKDFQEGFLPFLSFFLSFKAIETSLSIDGYENLSFSASLSSKESFKFETDKVLDPKAIAYFEQSLATARVNKDRNRETIALVSLSLGYSLQGDYFKAITTLEQTMKIVRELKVPLGEAIALGALGYAYNSQGDYSKAIATLEQTMKIVRELKVPLGEAIALGTLGYAYNSQGDYPKAIATLDQSLKIVRELNNTNFEVVAIGLMVSAYNSQGNYPKAIELGEQLLKIGLKEPIYKAAALNSLGSTYSAKGDQTKAISYYEQVLELKGYGGEEGALSGLAVAYAKLGDPKEITYLEQTLAIYRKQSPKDGEKNIRELGETYADLGKYPQALSLFQESVSILKENGDRTAVSKAFIDLGDLLIKQKHPELAILYYKQAINTIESIRGNIRQIGKQQQRSYVGKVERTYRNLADLLLQQGRVTEALQVLDLLKVQELEDYFKTFSRTDATAKGIPLLPAEQSAIGKLSQDQLASRNQQLATALKQEIATERDRFPDALRQLPKGSALLYPVLLDDRLELVLFIPGQSPIHRSVAVKPDQIKEVIQEFRVSIQDPTSLDVMAPSKKLYDWLLRPLAPDLEKSNITTILYAPDKQLRYVPLTALHDGKQWVVERYEVGYLIAYNLADFKGAVPKNPRILAGALGKNSYPGLSPLPATLTEVESIATSIPETLKLLQDSFTRQSIQQNLQGRTIVHLATHAEFRGGSPDDSFILMGNGDKLTLTDLRDWKLPGVDLVVLSACQTGLGKADQGIEFLGFGYQMQLVGAKGTLSSLWSVSDGGTGILMDGFYRQFSKTPNSLTALRNAQLTMIRKGDSLTGESKRSYETLRSGLSSKVQGDLNHPYYWAAFIAIQNSFANTQTGDLVR